MTLRLPGSVLIFDDSFEEIKDLVNSLVRSGNSVVPVFVPVEEDGLEPKNIRLAVIDLLVTGGKEFTPQDRDSICTLVHSISKRTGFFLYLIWSNLVGPGVSWREDLKSIRAQYIQTYGTKMPGILVGIKGKEGTKYQQLIETVETFLVKNPEIGLIYDWERTSDEARDVTTDLLLKGSDKGIPILAQHLDNELRNAGSAARVINSMLAQVLRGQVQKSSLNNTRLGEEVMPQLADTGERYIADLMPDPPSRREIIEQFGLIYSSYAYCPYDEKVWTGDIYERSGANEYVVVVTPNCGIARDEPGAFRVVYGFALDADPTLMKKAIEAKSSLFRNGSKTTLVQLLRMFTGEDPVDNLHPLLFVPLSDGLRHLLINSAATRDVSRDDLGRMNRQCRIQTPEIELLLEKIAGSDRFVGTVGIPASIRSAVRNQQKQDWGITADE